MEETRNMSECYDLCDKEILYNYICKARQNNTMEHRSDHIRWEIEIIYQTMKCFVNPSISIIGLIGNILSICILIQSGFKKPSNVFLLALTISDSLYLIRPISAPSLLKVFGPSKLRPLVYGWEFPENFAFFAFVVEKSIMCFVGWGSYVSTSLPAVITLERFIAVYFPLRLKTVVTVKRAIFIVAGIYFFWLFWSVFVYASWFSFEYHTLSEDVYYGIDVYSQFFFDNANIMFPLYFLALNYLTSVFPISITIVSCILIALKIRIAQRRRRKLTKHKKTYTSRTTRTLLAVSLIFAIAHGTYFILSYIFQDVMVAGTDESRVVGEFLVALVLFSSASNFFVYVFLNSGFRKLFLDMTLKHIICRKGGTEAV
ncbi:FMRFamide receptor-like [Physella acuta]|uniref:FMRFamide receptor-like n=1 Tax=Physella acuta TaxID=109671 RepID=UPI0027DC21B2|nr:FMRFamide receptor-like [Physella acuta]